MIIYCESNFILEIALGQEESLAAEDILALAENGDIELAFPSFALSEPFATVTQRGRKHKQLSGSLSEMLKELGRSVPHQQIVADLKKGPPILIDIVKTEFDLLQSVITRLLSKGRSIEIDLNSFTQARIYQSLFGLSPQDSIIYAAVVADLQRRPYEIEKGFVSRNWKDFDDPGIKQQLRSHNCDFWKNFEEALEFIQSKP